MYIAEDSGKVEAEIRKHHDNLRSRLEADFEAVLEKLLSLREAETKRLQMSINDLETRRAELEGFDERLKQLVSCGTDSDVIQANVTQKWKASGCDVGGSGLGAAIAFRQNSFLPQHQSNVVGELLLTKNAADNHGKLQTSCTFVSCS